MTARTGAVFTAHARNAVVSGRLEGIDLARGLAIIGMLMVHVGPMYEDGLLGQLYALPHGRASILFMLVAGVSVSLLAAARRGRPGLLTGQLLWRSALLLPAGLVLQVIDSGRLVILQTYAVMFVLAIAAVRLPDRVLVALIGMATVAGPVAFLVGRMQTPLVFDRAGVALGQSPGEILHGLVLSGPYPVVTWIVPFLAGMWLGRRDLRDPRIRTWLVLGGGAAALLFAGTAVGLQSVFGPLGFAATWAQLTSLAPHSQMPLWLAGSTSAAIALVGLTLALTDRAGPWLWPLIALGQMALTFYVAHLLALTEWPSVLETGEVGEAVWICLAFTAAAALFAVAWRAVLRRGPLEMLIQPPWLIVARWRSA